MAVRKGDVAKQTVTDLLLSTYEGAFTAEKKVYVPVKENGEQVYIAVSMAVPKALPNAEPRAEVKAEKAGFDWSESAAAPATPSGPVQLSEADAQKVAQLKSLLGLG